MNTGNDGYAEKELLRMVRQCVPRERVPKRVKIKDTSDFFRVDYDEEFLFGSTSSKLIHEARNCAVWVVE